MTAIPEVLDALTAIWKTAQPAGLRPDQVYDGPVVEYVGTEGIAVGASAEDISVDLTQPSTDVGGGQGERATVICMVWAGHGGTTFKPVRDRVDTIVDALEQALAADRSLGDVVSDAWLTSGSLSQLQTGRGALARMEIRVSVRRL